jgi:hypothetical protein
MGDHICGTGHGRRHPLGRLFLLPLLALASCSDTTGPPEDLNPALRRLQVDGLDRFLYHGGFVAFTAVPADLSFRLSAHQHVPVEIAVSSGDVETLGLFRETCPDRDRGWKSLCFGYMILMKEGHHASEIADHVAATGGRMYAVFTGRFAGVMHFRPGENLTRARQARSWPGVAWTELETPGNCQEWAPPSCWLEHGARLAAPIPVDTGPAIPGNGILEVRSGDTVTVSYRQPSGAVLHDSVVVP